MNVAFLRIETGDEDLHSWIFFDVRGVFEDKE